MMAHHEVTRGRCVMTQDFSNVYSDRVRAESYAALEFGCGAGRSTRFVRDLGCAAAGLTVCATDKPLGEPVEWVSGIDDCAADDQRAGARATPGT
jgi:hypothetical protein